MFAFSCAAAPVIPPKACVERAPSYIGEYLRDIELACGEYVDYRDCPASKEIEERYAKRDHDEAEKCTAAAEAPGA